MGRAGLETIAASLRSQMTARLRVPVAVRLAKESHADVILVDIDLGEESGFDLTQRLHDDPDVEARIILISTHAEDDFADLIAQSAALGFLSKSRLSAAAIRVMLEDQKGRPSGA